MLPEAWKREIEESQNGVAAPLNRLADEFDSYHSAQDTIEQGKRRRENRTIILLFLNALLVLITAVIFYCQLRVSQSTDATFKNILIAANRAWIAPLRTEVVTGVDDPEGPTVVVHYQNVGRAPATGVRIGMGPVAVDVNEPISLTREYPKSQLWEPLGKTFRELCNKNEPTGGMGAVYPSVTTESNVPSKMTTSWNKEKLLAGTQMIVVTACFSYQTMEIIGHSGLCNYIFLVAGRPAQAWEIRACPVANYAE
jgi:hypothetical protein